MNYNCFDQYLRNKRKFHQKVKNRCLRTGDKSHPIYGNPEEAPETKVFMDFVKHPLNPSYTSTQTPGLKTLPAKGYALVEEELASRELDEEILSKENEILESLAKVDECNQDANNNNETDAKLVNRRSKNTLNEIAFPPSSQCGLAIATVAYKTD